MCKRNFESKKHESIKAEEMDAALDHRQQTAEARRVSATEFSPRHSPVRVSIVESTAKEPRVDNKEPDGPEPSFGLPKFLFAIFLAILFFLLIQTMVNHRFFKGGRDRRLGIVVSESSHAHPS